MCRDVKTEVRDEITEEIWLFKFYQLDQLDHLSNYKYWLILLYDSFAS